MLLRHAYLPLISVLYLATVILVSGCTGEEEIVTTVPAGYAPAQAANQVTWQEKAMAYANAPTEAVPFENVEQPPMTVTPATLKPAPIKRVAVAKARVKSKRFAKAKSRRARFVAGRARLTAKATPIAFRR